MTVNPFLLRCQIYLGRQPKITANRRPSEPWYGGLPFFILSRVVRMFLLIAAMSALTALLWVWHGSQMPRHAAVAIFAGTGSLMSFGVLIVFQLLPAVRQLRLLRTLPIPVLVLSVALVSTMLLPLIALGGASAAAAGFALGTPAAITFLSDYIFALAPASLCVFLAVWLGEGKLGYVVLFVVFFGSQQVQLRLQSFLHVLELPLSLAGAIAGTCVMLALLLTTWALRSSRDAYRARAITPGSYPFGLGG